jgi:hypothetical protein
MPRTVVPPVRFRGADGTKLTGGDSFPERLAKYVPAETLAFFVPIAGFLDTDRKPWLITVLVAGAVGTLGYLWLSRPQRDDDEQPLPHFYLLACLAFLCWAVGTSAGVASLLGLDHVGAGIVLAVAVFLIPMSDEVLNRLLIR